MSATPAALLEALRAAVGFEAQGERVGNLTLGRGRLDARALRVALVENRVASGALGVAESERLAALLRVTARERAPLVLYLDSAGAKVSEGLKALGAFRALFRAGLEAALAGAPLAVVLGKNCYGGASMLAHLAPRRLFAPGTQLAMSGPAILAAGAGMDVLDEMFRAVTEASITASARARANPANSAWNGEAASLAEWLRASLVPVSHPHRALLERHIALGERLGEAGRAKPQGELLRRRDIERIYPEGSEVRESGGFVFGEGRDAAGPQAVIGILSKAPVGAERAWRFAQAAWKLAQSPPPRVRVLLDCATHAARLEDEKLVLTEYIVDMSAALAVLGARGTQVELTILGAAGGGVYVALAAPAREVDTLHGAAAIQVLPGAAIAAILGAQNEASADAAEYIAAGVADRELKPGIAP